MLGYEVFRADDNFLDIGGNSIMILKVHAFLDKDRPGIIQLPDLFAFPTIAKLAGYIDEQLAQNGRRSNESAIQYETTEESEDIEAPDRAAGQWRASVSGVMSTLNGGSAGEHNE